MCSLSIELAARGTRLHRSSGPLDWAASSESDAPRRRASFAKRPEREPRDNGGLRACLFIQLPCAQAHASGVVRGAPVSLPDRDLEIKQKYGYNATKQHGRVRSA